jgi:hypothetical protein
MAYQDIVAPEHRLANYGQRDFVQAYALVRHIVMIHRHEEDFGAFLRGVCEASDTVLGVELDIPATQMVRWLSDVGFTVHNCNCAKDEGESPVG